MPDDFDEDRPSRGRRDDRDDDRPRRRDDEDDDRPRRRRDEDDDRPRRRPRERETEATDFLIPTNVSAASMAACYFGIFSCFIPLLGFVMALIALPCGIVALRRRKKGSDYGAVTGDIRAVIGVIASSLTIVTHVGFFILFAVGALK
jgi:hypothetical protein